MSSIRIALIVEATTGGVARHVIDLVTRLDPAQFTCLLYLSFQRPDCWREPFLQLEASGIPLREIPMARVPNAPAVRQIKEWLQRDAVDIAHLHSAKAGYLGREATVDLGIPAIYTPHAFPFQRITDWRHPFYRITERKLARRTEKIICVSEGEADEASMAGLPEDKLVVIPNGIDIAQWPVPTPEQRRQARVRWGLADNDLVIGAMARLVPQKGIDLLLVAAEELFEEFRGARLVIWGDGPDRRMLLRLARRLGVRRVHFPGEAHNPWQAYAAMDIFCAPSRWEAGPYAVLEAMACGLPVIASEVPGHVDYLENDVSGLIVPAELPGPLDGALRTLLIDADRRDALGEAARHRVIHAFTVERMVADTAALYREVAKKGVIPILSAMAPAEPETSVVMATPDEFQADDVQHRRPA